MIPTLFYKHCMMFEESATFSAVSAPPAPGSSVGVAELTVAAAALKVDVAYL